MLEKMFTTKMSMDKEKLQNRFSKIRSKNGKTSKFIAMAVFAIIIVSIICVSIWVAVNRQDDTTVNSDIKLTFNGELLEFNNEPYVLSETMEQGYTAQLMAYFPLEELCKNLGVECEIALNKAIIKVNGVEYEIEVGRNQIFYNTNGKGFPPMDFTPEMKNYKIYIPYEFIERIFIVANNYTLFGSILYKNEKMNVQFELPMHWLGKYIADETTVNDGYIEFKHRGISEKHDGMGTLFNVIKLADSEIEEHMNMVGNMTVMWRNQDYGYLIGRPTDVQLPIFSGNDEEDIKLSEEYAKMYKEISYIESTFSLIDDVYTLNIANAENMSYAQIKELQRQVNNGHFPWRLDYEQVMQMYLSGIGESVENGKLTYFAGDGEGCTGTYIIGGKRYTLELFKPIDKSENGIWIVKSVKELGDAALKEISFSRTSPAGAWIEKAEDGWYKVPQTIHAHFPWFEVGEEPYPISVTAYFVPAGTEMDEYKKEIGKIKAPFSYHTMAQVLSVQLEFPKDATIGHLWFVFNFQDGSSESSDIFNVLMEPYAR